MLHFVAHIENVENVHSSTTIKPKISLKTMHKKRIRNNGKRNKWQAKKAFKHNPINQKGLDFLT